MYKKKETKKEHYDWRDSFDLDEQALNMAQRRAARGSRPAPAPKPQIKPMPTTAEIRAANPGKVGGGNAGASADSGGTAQIPTRTTFTRQGKERTRSQQMAADRIASKKASPMDRQLSGRERAQQMARERIAAKRAQVDKPAAQSSKPTPAGTPVRKVTSSTTQSGNTTTTQTNVNSGVTGGTTKDLTSSAGSLQKNKQKAKQLANTANKNAAISGSGATTTVGKIDDF